LPDSANGKGCPDGRIPAGPQPDASHAPLPKPAEIPCAAPLLHALFSRDHCFGLPFTDRFVPERENEIALQYLIDDGYVRQRVGRVYLFLASPHHGQAMTHAR
jgi:hypothetical protein